MVLPFSRFLAAAGRDFLPIAAAMLISLPQAAPAAEQADLPSAAAAQKAARKPALAGIWQIEAINGKRTTIGMRGELPNMEFSQGRFSGHSGCNGFSGAATVKGTKLKLTRPMATLMACPQPIMAQEHSLYEALPAVRFYRYAAGESAVKTDKKRQAAQALQLLDGKGRIIIALARK